MLTVMQMTLSCLISSSWGMCVCMYIHVACVGEKSSFQCPYHALTSKLHSLSGNTHPGIFIMTRMRTRTVRNNSQTLPSPRSCGSFALLSRSSAQMSTQSIFMFWRRTCPGCLSRLFKEKDIMPENIEVLKNMLL